MAPSRIAADALAWSMILCGALAAPAGNALALETQRAQNEPEDVEKKVRRQRNGAGIRANAWRVRDLEDLPGARESEGLLYEGYFAKGLDLHLALESTAGFYRRSERTDDERLDSYLVPLFTAIKFFPWTRPEDRFEPFLEAGAGLALGIEEREITTMSLLGGARTEREESMSVGFGLKAGPGFDWRFSKALGLTLGGRYEWIRFSQEIGGARTYQGLGVDLGLTYRFQYE